MLGQLQNPISMKSGSDKNKKRKSDKSSNDSDGYQLDGSSEKDEARNGKKRFVWPDSLHKDFISAVFDIGTEYLPFPTLINKCIK